MERSDREYNQPLSFFHAVGVGGAGLISSSLELSYSQGPLGGKKMEQQLESTDNAQRWRKRNTCLERGDRRADERRHTVAHDGKQRDAARREVRRQLQQLHRLA